MADQQSSSRTGPDGESGEHRVPPPPRVEDRIPGQPVSRPSRWSGIGPGRRPLLFATVVAAIYATVILLVANVGLVLNTDDGGSWAELVGAVVGNFILVGWSWRVFRWWCDSSVARTDQHTLYAR